MTTYETLLNSLLGTDGLSQEQHDFLLRQGAKAGCKVLLQAKMISKVEMKEVLTGTWVCQD